MRKLCTLFLLSTLVGISVVAYADDGRFQLEKSGDSYVRLDTQTGEMSICEKRLEQLVCRVAAEERAAFQEEIDRLDQTVEDLLRRVAKLENQDLRSRDELPSEEEFERTLGFMEMFMRRFMGIIEEFDRAPMEDNKDMPDRT